MREKAIAWVRAVVEAHVQERYREYVIFLVVALGTVIFIATPGTWPVAIGLLAWRVGKEMWLSVKRLWRRVVASARVFVTNWR